MALAATLLLVFLAGQFLFAGAETGLVTWNTLKIGHRAAGGNALARRAVLPMHRKDALRAAVLVSALSCVRVSQPGACRFMVVDSEQSGRGIVERSRLPRLLFQRLCPLTEITYNASFA